MTLVPGLKPGLWETVPGLKPGLWETVPGLKSGLWVTVPGLKPGLWVTVSGLKPGLWEIVSGLEPGFWKTVPGLMPGLWESGYISNSVLKNNMQQLYAAWNVNEWILGNAKLKCVGFRWCMGTVLGIFGCCVGERTTKALVKRMSSCSHGSIDWNMGYR